MQVTVKTFNIDVTRTNFKSTLCMTNLTGSTRSILIVLLIHRTCQFLASELMLNGKYNRRLVKLIMKHTLCFSKQLKIQDILNVSSMRITPMVHLIHPLKFKTIETGKWKLKLHNSVQANSLYKRKNSLQVSTM